VKNDCLALAEAAGLGKRAFRMQPLASSIAIYRKPPGTISLRYFPHPNSLIPLIAARARNRLFFGGPGATMKKTAYLLLTRRHAF